MYQLWYINQFSFSKFIDYPCPLFNVISRNSVYGTIGRTILDLLAVSVLLDQSITDNVFSQFITAIHQELLALIFY